MNLVKHLTSVDEWVVHREDIFLSSWAIFGIKELSSAEGNSICDVVKINVKLMQCHMKLCWNKADVNSI